MLRTQVSAALLASAFCASACMAPGADPYATARAPIIGGVPSSNADFPSAGVILMRSDVYTTPMCTGTLIAPDVVMTAGHCTIDYFGGQAAFELFFSFTLDVSSFGQTTTDLPPRTTPVVKIVTHPSFDINSQPTPGLGNWYDVGVLFLSEAVTDVTPEVVADELDFAAIVVGTPVDIAGYGMTDPVDQAFGVKTHAVSVINEIGSWEMQIGDLPPVPQKCHGDSGGPTYMFFDDGRQPGLRLIGITSRAYDESDCYKGGIDMRADSYRPWFEQEMVAACNDGTRHPDRCVGGGGLPHPSGTPVMDAGLPDSGGRPDSGVVLPPDGGIPVPPDSGVVMPPDSGIVPVGPDAGVIEPQDAAVPAGDASAAPLVGLRRRRDHEGGCGCNTAEPGAAQAPNAWAATLLLLLAIRRPAGACSRRSHRARRAASPPSTRAPCTPRAPSYAGAAGSPRAPSPSAPSNAPPRSPHDA